MIEKVALLTFFEGHLLMVKKHGLGPLINTGGRREPGESDIQCLVREMKEELSVGIDPMSLSYFDTFVGPSAGNVTKGEQLKIICYVTNDPPEPSELVPANEIESFAWVNRRDGMLTTQLGKEILGACYCAGLVR
jgi:8-oxo-dGTP pyrophosphatase MutT (NUDIX family)